MKPFDGRKGKRLDYEIVGDMRFFGFYIGNDTLLINHDKSLDMGEIYQTSERLGMIYGMELFCNYDKFGQKLPVPGELSSTTLIIEYVRALKSDGKLVLPTLPFDKAKVDSSMNWRYVTTRFFRDFGMLQLNTEPLKGFDKDYADDVVDYGSGLELVTALFLNVLRMDKDGYVINEEWARHRASQLIRSYSDDAYEETPAFKEWETMLWI